VPKHAISAKVLKKDIAAQKKARGEWSYNYLKVCHKFINTSFIFIFNNKRLSVGVLRLNEIVQVVESSAVEYKVSAGSQISEDQLTLVFLHQLCSSLLEEDVLLLLVE
jgi:hypothetical protein